MNPKTERTALWPAGALAALHLSLSLCWSHAVPWGGDEWHTYGNQWSLLALPNFLLVRLAKSLLGPLSSVNVQAYRRVGFVWAGALMAFLARRFARPGFLGRRIALFLLFYVGISSYAISQTQTFRYYGLYLFCAVLFFYEILAMDSSYERNRRRFCGLLLLSPFLHYFLTWQLVCYCVAKELRISCARRRWLMPIVIGSGAILALIFMQPIMSLVIKGAAGPELTRAGHRGLSLGLLAKPALAVFQFLFGYDVMPTEHWATFGLSLAVCGGFLFRLRAAGAESSRFWSPFLMAGLVPVVAMHWVLEPLTFPGSTQFESKHALFFLPWFLAASLPIGRRPAKAAYVLPGLILCCAAWGTAASFRVARPDWSRVVSIAVETQRAGGWVAADKHSLLALRTFGRGRLAEDRLVEIMKAESLAAQLTRAPAAGIVTADWKLYQALSLKQAWNSGRDISDEYRAVLAARHLAAGGRRCTASYGSFPVWAFLFQAPALSAAVNPEPLDFPYRDISFPIERGARRIFGCQAVRPGEPWELGNRVPQRLSFLHFVRGAGSIAPGTPIGAITGPGSRDTLLLGRAGGGAYVAANDRALFGAVAWFPWHKRPVLTQSLNYPGAFWPAEAAIYEALLAVPREAGISIDAPGVTLYICDTRAETK